MEIQSLFDRARQLIKDSNNPIMFIDTDSDGSMSYVQLNRSFPQIDFAFPITYDEDSQNEGVSMIEDKHDLILIFDKARLSEEFFKAANGRQIIWCDHHMPDASEELRNKYSNLLYINPMIFNEEDSRCSTFIAYEIFPKKENLFYAVLGSVADSYILDNIIELYEYDKNLFNLLFKISDKKREEMFTFIRDKTSKGEFASEDRMVWTEYLSYECGFSIFKNFFDIVFKIQKPNEVIGTLRKIIKMTPQEFKLELLEGKTEPFSEFRELMDEYKKVYASIKIDPKAKFIFAEHSNTSISFNRQLAEEFGGRHENWSAIMTVYSKDEKDFVSFSFRGRDTDVNSVIVKCMEGLDGNGGGHKFAAGGIVSKKDYEEFKKRVFEMIG